MRPYPIIIALLTAATPAIAQAPAAAESPEAGAALAALERVCLPLAKGASIKALAAPSGLREENGQWVLPIRGHEQVVVAPPDGANPHLCVATMTYQVGQTTPIVSTLTNWAAGHTPKFTPDQTGVVEAGPAISRHIWSWNASTPKGAAGVVFTAEKTLDGKPVARDLDQAVLLVEVTPTSPS